jgi:hypothetical protein
MVEKLTIVLFVLALILETAGFLLGAEEHIPFVLRFTSPDYLAATQGIKTIQSGETLRESIDGFEQIAKIFLDEASAQKSPEVIKQIRVQQFRLEGISGLVFGRAGVRETVSVTVTLSNGQRHRWELPDIKTKVDELKAHNLFVWAVFLFIAGTILQILVFIVDRHGKRRLVRDYE